MQYITESFKADSGSQDAAWVRLSDDGQGGCLVEATVSNVVGYAAVGRIRRRDGVPLAQSFKWECLRCPKPHQGGAAPAPGQGGGGGSPRGPEQLLEQFLGVGGQGGTAPSPVPPAPQKSGTIAAPCECRTCQAHQG